MKKRLLNEETTRRFMKLANIGGLSESFVTETETELEETETLEETYMEEEEPEMDMGDEEPALGDEAPLEDEEEMMEQTDALEEETVEETTDTSTNLEEDDAFVSEIVRRVAERILAANKNNS